MAACCPSSPQSPPFLLLLILLLLLGLVPPSLCGSCMSFDVKPNDYLHVHTEQQEASYPQAQGICVYFRNGLIMQTQQDKLHIRSLGGDGEDAGTSLVLTLQAPVQGTTQELLEEAAQKTGLLVTNNAATYGSSSHSRHYLLTRTDTRETYDLGSKIIGSGEGFAGKLVVLEICDSKIIRHLMPRSSVHATDNNQQQLPETKEFLITWKKTVQVQKEKKKPGLSV